MNESGDSTPQAAALARRIAHDVRTPTGVIAGVLDELSSLEGGAAMITIARRAVRRLEWIARRMDWVSAVVSDSVRSQSRDQTTFLTDMVTAACASAEAVGGRRGITIAIDHGSTRDTIAAGRLWQHVVEEIVINALRHARSRVAVRVVSVGGEARVAVEDDGSGITTDRISSLFEQPEHKTLGLWLARRLARAAEGDVRHDDVANGGARFFIDLPVRTQDA